MRTEHLTYFLSIAKTGSITQTSLDFYTTHQNVSKVLRQLEENLGTKLFIRTSRGLTLSTTGKIFLPVAEQAMQAFDQVRLDIAAVENAKAVSGALEVIGSEVPSLVLLNRMIQKFAALHPQVNVNLINKSARDVLQDVALHPDKIGVTAVLNNPDFADLYEPYLNSVRVTPLLQDVYCAVIHNDLPLADANSMSLKDFARYEFSTLSNTQDDDSEEVLSALVKRFGGRVAFTSNNFQTQLQTMMSGRYAGIASKRAYEQYVSNHYHMSARLVPFREDMHFSIALVENPHATLSEVSQAFVDFLKNDRRC